MRNIKITIIKCMLSIAALAMILNIMCCIGADEIHAAQMPEFEISSAEGRIGDVVKITVSVKSNPGIAGAAFKLKYDEDILTLVSAGADTGIFKSAVVNTKEKGFVGFVYAGVNDISDDGTVLVVEFRIIDAVTISETELLLENLDICNANEEIITSSTKFGKIEITDYAPESESVKIQENERFEQAIQSGQNEYEEQNELNGHSELGKEPEQDNTDYDNRDARSKGYEYLYVAAVVLLVFVAVGVYRYYKKDK